MAAPMVGGLPGIRLETARLRLRPIDPERDFEPGWREVHADIERCRHIGGVLSPAMAWRSMCLVIGHWHARGYGFLSVEDKAGGAWVGRVGPWFPEGWPEPEIGWVISHRHRRRGYAVEATTAVMDWVFDDLGWSRVTHLIAPGNTASIAVAETLGSGFLRRHWLAAAGTEALVHGQTADAWRRRPRG